MAPHQAHAIPQGSILGPSLFLCYVNDMFTSVSADCKLILYADDSAILFSHKNPDLISQKMSEVMETCSCWLVDNKLSLHLGKTECVLFGPRKKLESLMLNVRIKSSSGKIVLDILDLLLIST